VLFPMQPYKKNSLKVEHYQKISLNFYVPYTILKKVGLEPYDLALPSLSKLHHVLYVLCLKKVIGTKF
jgi:hypothetical protein